jgi:hypothetical protein
MRQADRGLAPKNQEKRHVQITPAPGIPEGTDPATIVDDGINPPYVASDRPYVPPTRPAAPAVAPSPAAGKPTYKKVTTSDVVIQTATWGLLFLVLFFGGIAAVANSALWA